MKPRIKKDGFVNQRCHISGQMPSNKVNRHPPLWVVQINLGGISRPFKAYWNEYLKTYFHKEGDMNYDETWEEGCKQQAFKTQREAFIFYKGVAMMKEHLMDWIQE